LKNRVGNNINNCFDEAGFLPKVYTTSATIQVNEFISFTGLAAAFSTRTSLHNLRGKIPEDLNIFPLYHMGKPLIEKINIIHHKDRYLCHYNQYFFQLILNYFQKLEKLPIEQLVSTGLKDYYTTQKNS